MKSLIKKIANFLNSELSDVNQIKVPEKRPLDLPRPMPKIKRNIKPSNTKSPDLVYNHEQAIFNEIFNTCPEYLRVAIMQRPKLLRTLKFLCSNTDHSNIEARKKAIRKYLVNRHKQGLLEILEEDSK